MPAPSNHQIERFIRECAEDSFRIAITSHARKQMRERYITSVMVFEALRMGRLSKEPEPDMKHPGLCCRMERLVAGVRVAAVVYIEYPDPDLTVVTVINLGK